MGALGTLLTIFTTESKSLFEGMTSRRFCTCEDDLTVNIILPWYRNIQEYCTMAINMWDVLRTLVTNFILDSKTLFDNF